MADAAVDEIEQGGDVAAARGHHESGDVVDRVPRGAAEGGAHRGRIGSIRHEMLDTRAGSSVAVRPRLSTATS